MSSNFAKLDKFEGVDFQRWQKKMHFLLSSMSVVYVLTTPMPKDGGDDAIVEQIRKRAKWDNNDYDSLEAKYMAEDASSKKFIVSNFTNYKMTDSRPVLEQYNELLGILGRFTQHKMNMDESIQVLCIIDKLPPLWKDFKNTLKHLKEELTLVELGNHLRIKESLRMQDSDKPKGNNVVGPSVVNMVEHNNSSRYNDNKGKRRHHDNTKADPNKKSKVTCWKCGKPGHLKKDCKGGKVSNKANRSGINGSVDGSTNSLKGQNMFNKSFQVYYVTYVSEAYFVQDDDVAWWVDSGVIVHVCKDRCWFKTYESLNDGSILYMGNESTALVHGRGCVDLKFSFGKIVSMYRTSALSKFSPETKLVLYPFQDKLTLGDKSLDLSAFKLSRLFFSLLSSGSSSCWRSYGAQKRIFKKRTKTKLKSDKTDHENGKSLMKPSKSKSQQNSQPRQSQSQLREAESEEYKLEGP
ncbi:zinc finger, CCHC-type containing protein [Tanacetum coccineum]|uniref:Zinc finger, CCHC-type containing protein n=1 Tax=Tanacetum coccineum TaxID=301880 RepID=A0ABQ5ILC8_9ASTR